ncbi:MAG: nucleotide sugar dehydrogenase [Acidobacteria bacterium]|nr:nucleotide sugar dehydrogenase [Acidobacteriota bacterium]
MNGENNILDGLLVDRTTPLTEILKRQAYVIERRGPAGIALVVDRDGALIGTITDGDVRRGLLAKASLELTADEIMNPDPIAFREGQSFREILRGLPSELEKRGRRTRRFLGKIVTVDEARRPVRVIDYHQLWEQRVATHRRVVVVGLGYVGLTLALVMAEEGYSVTGVDADSSRLEALRAGRSYVHEIGLPELLREQMGNRFLVDNEVPNADVFIVAVGTPVVAAGPGKQPSPDLTQLEAACLAVGERLSVGDLVVLRSTVPVGTTRNFVGPLLERVSSLRAGTDFHLSFAPERTVEGKALQELRTLPQIIGGLNEDSIEATAALFRELAPTMVRVESLEAAEMVKLVNNGFRDLVFAFSNELVKMAAQFNIDAAEVIRAANRGYPRDPVPMPSPGVGGPCLSKDPYILAALSAGPDGAVPLSVHARRVNESMSAFVVDEVIGELEARGKDPRDSIVLVCGLAFKGNPETGDVRNSPSMEIARLLKGRVGAVMGHDPVADPADYAAAGIEPVAIPEGFRGKDAVLFLNNHPSYKKVDAFSLSRSLNPPGIVYDPWTLIRREEVLATGCVYMGLGFSKARRIVTG